MDCVEKALKGELIQSEESVWMLDCYLIFGDTLTTIPRSFCCTFCQRALAFLVDSLEAMSFDVKGKLFLTGALYFHREVSKTIPNRLLSPDIATTLLKCRRSYAEIFHIVSKSRFFLPPSKLLLLQFHKLFRTTSTLPLFPLGLKIQDPPLPPRIPKDYA